MRNRVTITPQYKMFDFKTAWMICDYDRKLERQKSDRTPNAFDKFVNCFDILTGSPFDRFATLEFDYVLIGSDHLLNAIVSSRLALKGKKTLIHAIPEFNLPEEYQKLEKLRFNLQNEMFCKMVSERLFGKQFSSIDLIIEECFNDNVFDYGKHDFLPVLNQKRMLHIREGERFEMYTGVNASYPVDLEILSLRKSIPSVKLLKGYEGKSVFNAHINYDNLIYANKIIVTSASSSKLSYLDESNENIIKMGSAATATVSYDKYTIVDRFKEINEAIKIADSM